MCRQPAFGVFIANVCIRSFRSRISGRWSSPTFGTASCSACCGHGGTDVFPDCLFVPVGYADGTQTVVCQPVRTSGFLEADAGYRCGLLCPVVFHYGFPSGYDLQQGDADSDEHGGFLFPQFLFHVCVGRLFCLPVATSFDP